MSNTNKWRPALRKDVDRQLDLDWYFSDRSEVRMVLAGLDSCTQSEYNGKVWVGNDDLWYVNGDLNWIYAYVREKRIPEMIDSKLDLVSTPVTKDECDYYESERRFHQNAWIQFACSHRNGANNQHSEYSSEYADKMMKQFDKRIEKGDL